MIITLKGADFSTNNINDLIKNWNIVLKGGGLTSTGPYSVLKDSALDSFTITVDTDNYTFDGTVTVTMGGNTVSNAYSISGNVITINKIEKVTGKVEITVGTTKNTAGGEEGGNDDVLTLDSIAYDDKTYRDIFITNNKMPNFETDGLGNLVNTSGTVTLQSDKYNTPTKAAYVTGTSTQQAKLPETFTGSYYLASKVHCTRYTKGYIGLPFGSNFGACINKTNNEFETVSYMATMSGNNIFVGSASSANLDGYIDDPVMINMNIFTTAPSKE